MVDELPHWNSPSRHVVVDSVRSCLPPKMKTLCVQNTPTSILCNSFLLMVPPNNGYKERLLRKFKHFYHAKPTENDQSNNQLTMIKLAFYCCCTEEIFYIFRSVFLLGSSDCTEPGLIGAWIIVTLQYSNFI